MPDGRWLELEHGFVGRQKQPISGAAGEELDRSGGLTLIRLEEQRQRQRIRRERPGGGRRSFGRSSFDRSWPTGIGGMFRVTKIEHDACGG